MATHDAGDKSGGLDASVRHELERPQNVGIGMANSLADFNPFRSPSVTMADAIALGTALAAASCNGPVIRFCGGRLDAAGPGPETVPEPEQTLDSHIESFKRQGFTQTEMIALVACGHTLGGVRREDFPLIVDTSAENGFANFDGTPRVFDNTVVKEYLDGTTTNPLVAGVNVTTRSDLRIFASVQNATMQSLASADTFSKTCAALFERMIDTVPGGVKLTDPIDLVENKIGGAALFTSNGSYIFRTNLRRLSENPDRRVTLFWKERRTGRSICPAQGCSAQPQVVFNQAATRLAKLRGQNSFPTYAKFEAQIPVNASISHFWFAVDENDGAGSGSKIVDNGGAQYRIEQDTMLFDPGRTSIVFDTEEVRFRIVVGVRDTEGEESASKVSLKYFRPGPAPTFVPIVKTVELGPDAENTPADGYTFYTAEIPADVTAFDLDGVVGGQTFRQNVFKRNGAFAT
ncbi:putative peroxidase family protein [Lyophyllum shimeji]|uniref:Peroxidase n=1 Tax=Lyophyllum shimeji TaxID=47721 RepID=A0A9P3UR17_LYOSH|nr:putative peroxidase family protein [Lyophyllum shimeji]